MHALRHASWFAQALLFTLACASDPGPASTNVASTTSSAVSTATTGTQGAGGTTQGAQAVTNSATSDSTSGATSSGTTGVLTTAQGPTSSTGTGGASTSTATGATTQGGTAGASASSATGGATTSANVSGYCKSFYNSSGGANPCYIGTDGKAHCIVPDGSSVTLDGVPGTIVSVSGWDYTTRACAVNDAGAVYCGDYASMSLWVESGATQVSGLSNGQCAIINGAVECSSVSVPSSIDTGSGNVTVLGCYSDGCCAATDAPALYCWGDTVENFGVDSEAPFSVPLPAGKQVLAIGAGQVHVCVLLDGGQVQCWGQDWNGQLGGMGSDMGAGITVVASGASAVASGQFHTCISFVDGSVKCAGLAGVHGAGQNSMTLSEVPGISGAIAITAGRYASCALLGDGSIQCWGDYGTGAQGTNETTTPVAISGVPAAPCQ